jgi:hypothetical protein
MVSKICSWDGGVCRLASCDRILGNGVVVLCERHKNVFGRCSRKRIVCRSS